DDCDYPNCRSCKGTRDDPRANAVAAAELSPARQSPPMNADDTVDHAPRCNFYPSGVECITIVEQMSFNLGNAVTYIWRAGEKGALMEDLKKARGCIDREIRRLSGQAAWNSAVRNGAREAWTRRRLVRVRVRGFQCQSRLERTQG